MIDLHARLHLAPRRLAALLCLATGVLALLSAGVQFIRYASPFADLPGLLKLDAGWEASIPTYFSALLFLASALLLLLVGRIVRQANGPFARHWTFLGLLFMALSIDEVVSIHEGLSAPTRALLGASGLFYYAWVLPALVLLAGLGLAYLRFLRELPSETRRWFVLSAAVFLSGAVGMELVGGLYAERSGEHTLAYGLLATLEETLEMTGLVVFLYALLAHLGRIVGTVALRFTPA